MSLSHFQTTAVTSLAWGRGILMRFSVAVAIACLSVAGLSAADEVKAAVRRNIDIPAQGLGPALQRLAKERRFQIVYVSDEVNSLHTQGASGELTAEEALTQLLRGTGLTFRSFGENAVSIVPAAGGASSTGKDSKGRLKDSASLFESLRLAQIDESSRAESSSVPRSSETGGGSQQRVATLEEVLVTARRREELLRDVPVAVTALTAEDLQNKQVETGFDLQYLAPSLNVSSTYSRWDNFYVIRGMGPSAGGPGVVSYFAEVPGAGEGLGLFLDLENVQVVNGPQGTLFGKNTTGGVVLFTPHRPTNEFEGNAEIAVGNYDMRKVTGVVNVPVIDDKLMMRFAGEVQKRSGFTTDRGPDFAGTDYDDRDYWTARASVLIRPSEVFENYTIVHYLRSETNGDGYVFALLNPNHGRAGLLGNSFAEQQVAGPRSTAYSTDTHDVRLNYGVINTTQVELTDAVSLKNIASYQVKKWQNAHDVDATTFVLMDLPGSRPRFDEWHTQQGTFTEELQLQGRAMADDLTWTVGAYYERTEDLGPQPYEVHCCEDGVPGGFTFIQVDYESPSSSKGLYAQTTYAFGGLTDALEGLKLTTGYRRTWDSKRFGQAVYSPTMGNACTTTAGIYPQSDCFARFSGESEGDSWTVSLDYELGDDWMVYLRSGRGYKAGGFNSNIAFAHREAEKDPRFRYKPERVTDVEFGVKSRFTLAGMESSLSAAVFRSIFEDIQRPISTRLPAGDSTFEAVLIANASEAEIEGLELQGSVLPFTGFRFDTTYSYNRGKYTKIDPLLSPALVGVPFSYLPKHKVSASGAYTLPLAGTLGEVTLRATYAYQSEFFNAPTIQPLGFIEAYDLLNVSLDWNSVLGSSVDVSLFGTNVTDELYRTSQHGDYAVDGQVRFIYGEPRMYGARLRYRF